MEYKGHSSDPDPLDTSVLVLQDRHKSHLVDSGQVWVTPLTYEIKGSAISIRWLCHQFSHPPIDLDDATLERKILMLHFFQLWSWERLYLGRPDFGQPPTPSAAQHLEHDVTDDLPRWRVSLSWAQNPSRVLTFYRDQLDTQTLTRRRRHKYDLGAFYAQYITLWASRAERIATTPLMMGAMQFHDLYMEWCIRRHSSDCY
ncbi:hypothetical protein CK203_096587 [Vitis vinifera]|uniref:Serine/threonine-protein phosphatase 7 long form-like n=1 Tax=Vitis vinifera TaxID=29760 RepID=A0A438DDB2_VITVI|nr:hypothetical protein CK203_096587 [Vitis vinifera]